MRKYDWKRQRKEQFYHGLLNMLGTGKSPIPETLKLLEMMGEVSK
jgi:hypothetical protein